MYDICNTKRITIGRVGENMVKQLQFNMTEWDNDPDLKDANYIMLYQRPEEDYVYQPYMITNKDDHSFTWLVTTVDTGIEGSGVCEIQALDGNTGALKKSTTIVCVINSAMTWDRSSDVPDALRGWAERLAQREAEVIKMISESKQTVTDLIAQANEAIRVQQLEVIEEQDGWVELHGMYAAVNEYYPIGSYYSTESLLDPSVLFGGRWEKVSKGVLYADEEKYAGETGGQESVVLTKENLPKQ